jgi:23S rRNA pseudouridine1911/1915/1917 synthase
MEILNFTVYEKSAGKKIVDFLKCEAHLSANLVKRVKFGGVSVNGNVVTMRKILNIGDKIEIRLPDEKSENVLPVYAALDVVFEDEYLLIVNKPKNMPTHPSRGNTLVTLANAVAYYLGKPSVFRAINRLDRDTSGLVLIAKDAYSGGILGKMMKNREIEKKYTAVISGIPKERHGIIDAKIARECENNIKRVVRDDGKRAVTEYTVVSDDGENAVCEITLHTGRTHQIRVHFAYIGHPLLNDFLYGEQNSQNSYTLHCSSLKFRHPVKDAEITVSSPLILK